MSIINSQPECQTLMAIEGIGPNNALGLSLARIKQGQIFAIASIFTILSFTSLSSSSVALDSAWSRQGGNDS